VSGAPDILMLAGPTASGKSALSLHAARALNAEIINADSMQIYSGLQILSARPAVDEMGGVAHHLFGVIAPSERCSVGHWTRLALACVETLRARGKRIIFVGGTGLYFKALLEGLAPTPDIPDAILSDVTALLQAEARCLDPVATARIEAGDRQRLMRVIAVSRAAGQPLSQLQSQTRPLLDPARCVGVVIQPDREALYARIEQRFDAMVRQGALEEARAILEQRLPTDLPAMKAVGLPPLLAHLQGALDLDAAIEMAKRDSRRYAKRQFTWFSNQHPDWRRITTLDAQSACAALDDILSDRFFGALP